MTKEYIERETLISRINGMGYHEQIKNNLLFIARMIPAADVAAVQHGRWIATHDEFCSYSVCKYPVYVAWGQTNYCPNCGAKMAEKAVKDEACQNGGN